MEQQRRFIDDKLRELGHAGDVTGDVRYRVWNMETWLRKRPTVSPEPEKRLWKEKVRMGNIQSDVQIPNTEPPSVLDPEQIQALKQKYAVARPATFRTQCG